MRLRALRSFRWAGEHVERASLFIVTDERDARRLVAEGDAELAEDADAAPPRTAMVVNADPVVQVRDPVAAPKGRRRS